MKTLAYIFGIFFTGIYIYTAFISRSVNSKRYKFRIIFSLSCLLLGFLLDISHIFNKPFGFITIWSAAPLIYLFYYFVLSFLMKPIIGDHPYSPYRDRIGSKPQGIGYPKNRLVKVSDYVFGITLYLLPLITIAFLLDRID